MKRYEPYKDDNDYDPAKMVPVTITELSNLGFRIGFDPPIEFLLYKEPDEEELKDLALLVITDLLFDLRESGIEPSITQETIYTTDELDNMGVFKFDDEVSFEDCPHCDLENEVPASLMFRNIRCSRCNGVFEIGPCEVAMSRNLTYMDMKDKSKN